MREPVTMEDWDTEEPPPRESRGFWPVWFWPVLVWWPLDAWHERFARGLPVEPAVLERAHLSPAALAWLATAFVPVAALAEAGFYGMLWSARGARLPLVAAAVAVLQAGVLDLVALRVLDFGRAVPAPVAALLAGPRALAGQGPAASALAATLGGAGLLALARCALFAALQAGLARRRFREAFALTCGTWLVSHLAQWWLLELFMGNVVFGRAVLGDGFFR